MRQILLLLLGLVGGAVSSQAPEYAQQYIQNLEGRISELTIAAEGYERAARGQSLELTQALDTLDAQGGFGAGVADVARETVARRDRLIAHRDRLADAGPFLRTFELAQGFDGEIADSTFGVYEPALPLTIEGGVHAAVGFVATRGVGVLALGGLAALAGLGGGARRRA